MPYDVWQLLHKDATKRLGSSSGDVDDLFAHPFFAPLDRAAMEGRRVAPPFVPEVKGSADTSNFDAEFTSRPAVDSVVPESVLKKLAEQESSTVFKDFGYAEQEEGGAGGLLAATRAAVAEMTVAEGE